MLIPNPEYALAEYEERFITNPAAKPISTRKKRWSRRSSMDDQVAAINALPRRWRSKDHEAVMKAWADQDQAALNKLCVPSHLQVKDEPVSPLSPD